MSSSALRDRLDQYKKLISSLDHFIENDVLTNGEIERLELKKAQAETIYFCLLEVAQILKYLPNESEDFVADTFKLIPAYYKNNGR